MAIFEALTFFLGPNLSTMRGHLSYVDMVPGSALPSTIYMSSTSCLEDATWPSFPYNLQPMLSMLLLLILWPSSTPWIPMPLHGLPLPQLPLFRSTLPKPVGWCAAWHHPSSSVVPPSPIPQNLWCHLGGHVSNTVKIVSLVAINCRFFHCCAKSFHALMYMLCISTLKSTKLCRLLCTIGDMSGLLLIHIQMLASMRTKKIFILWICFASLVA